MTAPRTAPQAPQGQQAVTMDAVADWYGRRVAGLMAELVQAQLLNEQLVAENNQLRSTSRHEQADPGTFAPADTRTPDLPVADSPV